MKHLLGSLGAGLIVYSYRYWAEQRFFQGGDTHLIPVFDAQGRHDRAWNLDLVIPDSTPGQGPYPEILEGPVGYHDFVPGWQIVQ